MSFQIIGHDGKSHQIMQEDPKVIAELASKLDLIAITLANGKVGYFSKGTVARLMEKDEIDTKYKSPEELGLVKNIEANNHNLGYKKFQEMRAKLTGKM